MHNDIIQFADGVAKVLPLAELQNCDAWPRTLQNKSKDHRYYEIVEKTLQCGFEHYYLLAEDNSGSIRAIQPVFFVRQNLVEGVPGKLRSIVEGIRKIFPGFLTMRVLMVGCGAGTGDLGACDEKDEPWLADALLAILRSTQSKTKLPWSSSRIFHGTIGQSSTSFAQLATHGSQACQ